MKVSKNGFGLRAAVGFLFVSVTGTILHFVYDWCGQSTLAGLFSAVNESTWEHMKLFYFPFLAFSVIEAVLLKRKSNGFWCVKLCGLLAGLLTIPLLYYTYTGIFGRSVDWFNITIFFIAAAVAFWVEYRLNKSDKKCFIPDKIALTLMLILGVVFMVLTFSPPKIPLFCDPVTKTYGRQ